MPYNNVVVSVIQDREFKNYLNSISNNVKEIKDRICNLDSGDITTARLALLSGLITEDTAKLLSITNDRLNDIEKSIDTLNEKIEAIIDTINRLDKEGK